MATGHPWSGTVELQVRGAPRGECGLAVRVPGWSPDGRFSVNGAPVRPDLADGGYLIVRRRWQRGDVLRCELDITPRLTYPSRRIDALRGAAAVERGPLVYCFEEADQPGAASVEDLALAQGDLAERDAALPGIGPTVAVESRAVCLPPARDGAPLYAATPDPGTAGDPATAVAIPYFQWDNRDGRAMRVWMPCGRPEETSGTDRRPVGPDAAETL
jgi:DUF1680 family protein